SGLLAKPRRPGATMSGERSCDRRRTAGREVHSAGAILYPRPPASRPPARREDASARSARSEGSSEHAPDGTLPRREALLAFHPRERRNEVGPVAGHGGGRAGIRPEADGEARQGRG